MSKKPKKWTPWIDWCDHPRPLIADEVMKIKLVDGTADKMTAEKILSVGYDDFNVITHYKRLLSNVEGGEVDRGTSGERLIRSAKQARAMVQVPEALAARYEDYTREGLLDKIEGLESDLESAVEAAYLSGAEGWAELNYPQLHQKFSTRLPVAERISKLKPKFDDPKHIITGPGVYRTRDGRNAVVNGSYECGWVGTVDSAVGGCVMVDWYEDGVNSRSDRNLDIIGSSQEPKTEAGRWSRLYREPDGSLTIGAGRFKNQSAAERYCASVGVFVGTVLLTHTEGEE